MVPEIRVQSCNKAPVHPRGKYVLYWMTANRRATWNFSLERAVERAMELNRPLLVFEALRCSHRWASDRIARFVLDGMAENARQLRQRKAVYFPYVEPKPDAARGLLAALAKRACVVVTDDFPCFFLPNMMRAAAKKLKVRLEKVDSNGLLPMRAANQVFKTAFDFRRFLQHTLPFYLGELVNPDPLVGTTLPRMPGIPREISERWRPETGQSLKQKSAQLNLFPLDHGVGVLDIAGGSHAANKRLRKLLDEKLSSYAGSHDNPGTGASRGLFPYLHFGHISAHEIFSELAIKEDWSHGNLAALATGKPEGWWGMGKSAEMFLDQFVTWRELGFNYCWQREGYDDYASVPAWARKTLEQHAGDAREYTYDLHAFEQAATHDQIWNAAQTQLVREGAIHDTLRALWAKKFLQWTETPSQALDFMLELNNKYAINGRDPGSYADMFWAFGRYDHACSPERPVFGRLRYLSSSEVAKKHNLKAYVEKYGAPANK